MKNGGFNIEVEYYDGLPTTLKEVEDSFESEIEVGGDNDVL